VAELIPIRPGTIFPFIVGSGRSGTTLLRAMFDSHPDLCIPGESGFITRLGRNADKRYTLNGRFHIDVFMRDLFAHPRFDRWHLDKGDVEVSLRDAEIRSFADAIRCVYAAYARSRGKPLYGDKTPVYVMHIPYLAELFEEARFVHIIRDGRDVALSHLSIAEWGPGTIEEAAQEWKSMVGAGRRAGMALASGRYVEIKYENLIADPEAALRPVCDSLGLPFDDRMLHYFERVDSILDPEYHPQHHQRIALPPTSNLRDWKTQMNADSLVRFEALAGSALDEFGYERSRPRVSVAARARSRSRLLIKQSAFARKRILRFARKAAGVR
jgi:Sulfotransferase family